VSSTSSKGEKMEKLKTLFFVLLLTLLAGFVLSIGIYERSKDKCRKLKKLR